MAQGWFFGATPWMLPYNVYTGGVKSAPAEAVSYLASPAARSVSGTALQFSGGYQR